MTAGGPVSVVVCAHSYERRNVLRAALESVRRQEQGPHELIVVIDHNPALKELVVREFPELKVVPNQRAKGLSGARNTGVRHAAGDIIAFLDDDAIAMPGWISRLRSHYESHRVIGVGGRVEPVWPDGRPRWFPAEFDWVVGCSYRGQPEWAAPVRNLIGCNMSFRRLVFDAIGGFGESLGREGNNAFGCEETEFCIRAGQAFPQSTIIYDPEVVVLHQLARERTKWRYFRSRCLAEGQSKAMVVKSVGAEPGLSSERRYVARVLPAGILRGIGQATLRFDRGGLARAGAIVAGLGFVSLGYQQGRRATPRKPRLPQKQFAPVRIVDLDIAAPLPNLEGRDPTSGVQYGGAFCLVRSAGRPIGVAEVPLSCEGLTPSKLEEVLLGQIGFREPICFQRTAPSADAPFVGVVVATRDRAESLTRCLDSLLRQDYANFEIVVVDNAPASSDTAELVSSRYAPTGRVRYVRDNRPGLGQAHNSGLAHTAAPIIAFTDDDVVVDRQWLAALTGNFDGNSEVGCVTGLILPAELDTRAQYWTERHGGFGKGFERRAYDLADNRPAGKLFPYAAGEFGSGANMAFSRGALQHIGGFDPALGAGTPARGADDLAAFVSVIRAGYRLIYEPEAIVWHHHRRGEDGMRRQAFGYGVGLGAYLTKLVIDEPTTLLDFAKAFPAAAMHVLSPSSPKNRRLPDDYPRSLVWRERLGILAGLPAYLQSRAALRRPVPAERATAISVAAN
jgi:GT2 family glycosyltransferase